MAQLNLGQVVPGIEITETSDGKNIKFTTLAQEVETSIKDGVNGVDGVSPIVTMSSTEAKLSITVVDAEGTKTKTVEKGMTVYYQDTEPTPTDTVVWIN